MVIGRAALESQGNFTASNLSLIGPPLLTLAGLLLLLVTHTFTPVNAAWCYVLSGVPSLIWMASLLPSHGASAFPPSFQSARLLLSYGIRSYGIDLCGTLSLYVDQALVVRILRPSMMGTYVVALSLSRMLNVFHTAVVMVLFPRAVSRPPREVLEMTGRAVRMTTLLTTLCGAGIMLAGPRLLVFLYGPEYRGAAAILRILVVEVILAGATQVMSQAFMALSRPGVITALQAIGLLLTVPLMLVLVPRFGIEGAALLTAALHLRPVRLRARQFFALPGSAAARPPSPPRRPGVLSMTPFSGACEPCSQVRPGVRHEPKPPAQYLCPTLLRSSNRSSSTWRRLSRTRLYSSTG